MKLSEIPDILESSILSEVFLDLNNFEIIDWVGTSRFLRLQIRNPFSEKDEIFLKIIEQNERYIIETPKIGVAETGNLIARVALVNHKTDIPKMCWNPEDKIVYAEWVFFNNDCKPAPIQFEWVLAKTLYVFYNEKIYFLMVEMEKEQEMGFLNSDKILPDFGGINKQLEEKVFPFLESVIG